MAVRRVEVERFSLTTSRPFESVVSALKAGIGQLDLAAFASASKSSGTFAELEEVINRNMGGSTSEVVLGILSRYPCSEGSRTRETEDREASDQQAASHEGNG